MLCAVIGGEDSLHMSQLQGAAAPCCCPTKLRPGCLAWAVPAWAWLPRQVKQPWGALWHPSRWTMFQPLAQQQIQEVCSKQASMSASEGVKASAPPSLEEVEHVIQLGVTAQVGQATHLDGAHFQLRSLVYHNQLLHQDAAHNVLPASQQCPVMPNRPAAGAWRWKFSWSCHKQELLCLSSFLCKRKLDSSYSKQAAALLQASQTKLQARRHLLLRRTCAALVATEASSTRTPPGPWPVHRYAAVA